MLDQSFRFLVTTDNHLGYKHADPVRSKDSFKAFKEALEISRRKDVDFILLGGDLFHLNKPSPDIEHRCIKIIRKHMNANVRKPRTFEKVAGSFSHCNKVIHGNFEDPNLSVSHPIFTIHGNHDDPTGPQGQSVCEKLATCALLNYFGAIDFTKSIFVEPIILQKDKLKIALYGMGYIPDYKLKSMFDSNEVTFARPPKDTFNILVVHQNRIPLNKSKYIPDEYYPKFFHLIVRGHEHASEAPTKLLDSEVNGWVFQPGSTVATSIGMSESGPRQVALVTVRVNPQCSNPATMFTAEYDLIQLKSSRRIIIKDIVQKDLFKYVKNSHGSSKITSGVFKRLSREYIEMKIENYLDEYKSQSLSSNNGTQSSGSSEDRYSDTSGTRLPLVRIRLEYATRGERFDPFEISAKFYPTRVANKDIVLFKKQKLLKKDDGQVENVTFLDDDDDDEDDEEFDFINLGEERRETIDFIMEGYFKDKPKSEQLCALSLNEYCRAVKGSSEEGNVISSVLNRKKQVVMNKFKKFISNEKIVEEYGDLQKVDNWFKTEFGKENANIAAGGDAWEDLIEFD